MNVYIVTYDVGDYEKTIDKVFVEMAQAEYYCREQIKKHNGMHFAWEEYRVADIEN
jgi:hypothetical protein